MHDLIKVGKKVFTVGVVASVIIWSLGVLAVLPVKAASAGDLIKKDGLSSVYYLGADSKRYVFPNEATYFSWYADFSGVKTVSSSELESYGLAKNITIRPGTKLVKITTDPKVYAVEPNGTLRHVATEAVAQTLFGTNWAKRVVDVPDAFFTNYTIGTQISTNAYPTGSLIKYASSPNIYYVNGTQKQLISTEAAFNANRFQWANVLTAPDTITLTDGTAITGAVATLIDTSSGAGGSPNAGTGLTVALASDTPAAATYLRDTGALVAQANAAFAKFNFTASSDGDVKVTTLKLNRSGISADTDLGTIYLYDGDTELAENTSFSSKVITFNDAAGLFTVTKGTTRAISIRADIAAANATVSSIILGINAAADITTDGAAVSGSFPLTGNAMAVTTVADLGYLNVLTAGRTFPATIDPGSTDQELLKFSAKATDQDIAIQKLKITVVGTVTTSDLANFKLETGGVQIGTTVAGMNASNEVLFDFGSSPYIITKGQTKSLSVVGDVVSGSARAFKLTIRQVSDLIVKDDEYGVSVAPLVDGAAFALYDPDAAGDGTNINAGTLTSSVATDSPTGNIASGATAVTIAKFGLKAVGENVKVTQMGVSLNEEGDDADVQNGQLYLNGVQVGSTVATMTDETTKTFSMNQVIAAGTTATVEFKADIVSAETTGGQTAGVALTANQTLQATFVGASCTAVGQSSLSTVTVSNSTGKLLTVKTGLLIPGKNTAMADATTTNPTGVPPATGVKVGSFTLTAGAGEAVTLTQVVIGDKAATWDVFGDDFQNLTIKNGTTVLAPVQSSLAHAGGDDYTFNLTPSVIINAGQQYVIDIYADIKSGATTGTAAAVGLEYISATASGNVTGTNASDATAKDLQKLYIATQGSLTITASPSTPVSANLVMGETDDNFAMLQVTAGTSENIQVSRIEISDTVGNFNSSLSNVKLYEYESNSQIGSTVATFDATNDVEFTLATPWVIPKGETKNLIIKASVNAYPNATSGGTVTLALNAAGDIDSLGVDSGQAIGETVSAATGSNMALYRTKLTVAKGASSPSGASVAGAGATVLEFTGTADSHYSAYLNQVAIKMSGSVDTTSTGDASIYKSTDLVNALATESYTALTADGAGSTTTVVLSTGFTGVPVGANVRVYDTSAGAYMSSNATFKVTKSTATTLTVTPAMDQAGASGDIVYYRPLQPGTGKLFFGAQTTVTGDLANGATSITVTSSDGFAVGDAITATGFTSAGVAISCTGAITGIADGTTLNVGGAVTCTPDSGVITTITHDYLMTAANAISTGWTGDAVVYTSAAANNITEAVTAGTTTTFVVKGDTTGATSTENLRADITAVGDLNWDDTLSFGVITNTLNLPLTGGTLTY